MVKSHVFPSSEKETFLESNTLSIVLKYNTERRIQFEFRPNTNSSLKLEFSLLNKPTLRSTLSWALNQAEYEEEMKLTTLLLQRKMESYKL